MKPYENLVAYPENGYAKDVPTFSLSTDLLGKVDRVHHKNLRYTHMFSCNFLMFTITTRRGEHHAHKTFI
jgi:hypothetical protein